jgi:GNAT superfamily N-acetyltransferase
VKPGSALPGAGGGEVRVETVAGAAIERYLVDLAALRIEVFREYPYLYDGSADYEERYLRSYAASPASAVALALAGDRVVGAATAMPLRGHSDDVVPPLEAAGYDPDTIYYFGESVLLPAWRGRGLGHAFFDAREAAARRGGFAIAAFCAVDRGEGHPARPAGYVPHDAFWRRRGYVRRPDIVARFSWRDLGDAEESEKPMVFWLRRLDGEGATR